MSRTNFLVQATGTDHLITDFHSSSSFSSHLRLLHLTHFGETPEAKILFHPIFWHNWKKYEKEKIYIFGNLNVFTKKKKQIFGRFSTFYGQRSVTAA